VSARSARTLYVEALEVLLKGQVARVARDRDWELLREVARLATPALFRTWREAVTRYHLAGWTNMTPERVDEAARATGDADRAGSG
jgi:hypothetical protein